MKARTFGSLVAGAVSSLLVTSALHAEGTTPAAGGEHAAKAPAKGKGMICQNAECKGKADCQGAGNASCAGKNECTGHGIKKADNQKACEHAHGKWIKG